MKLLHFTDIHLTTPGQTIGGRDPNANFAAGLTHALHHHPDAEALLITGDLSDWGDAQDYARLQEHLAALPLPAHLMIGNHDDRAIFGAAFPDLVSDGGFIHYTAPLSQGTAICLDTWGPETHAGHFCEARAAWLDAQLSALEGDAWLFMHHNPVPIHVAPMDKIMLLDADRFAATIKPHAAKIRHIFHGHCHLPLTGALHGIPLSAPRGTNHAGWADFAATGTLSSASLPQAYGVIFATPDTTLVHMIEFGHAGEITREGSPDYADWDRATMQR